MIYVDDLFTMTPRTAQARSHGNRWSHLFTDSLDLEELHLFAETLGLKRSYFQPHRMLPHYDLTPSKRALAVRLGAVETTTVERMNWAMERTKTQEEHGKQEQKKQDIKNYWTTERKANT